MTYLDSILKSRDFTLPTKVCIVKTMVFPVVMYGCEVCESHSHEKSCPTLCNPMDCSPWNSPGQNTGVGNLSLQIFPFQGSNPGLPHCRQILYQLSHQGSPRILEWIPYSFFSGSSQPMNWTGVSCIAGRFFTNWAIWAAPSCLSSGKRKTNTNGKALQW